MRLRQLAAIGLVAIVLAGCIGFNPRALQAGQTEAQVVQALGQPTNRYSLPDGVTRLEYAKGPEGKVTWMVDLDTSGKVTQFAQVLVPENFEKAKSGMTGDELKRVIGRPGTVTREGTGRELWSWRYDNTDCLWFHVSITAAGYVAGPGRFIADSACKGNQ